MIYYKLDWYEIAFGILISFNDVNFARIMLGPLTVTWLMTRVKRDGEGG